MKVHLTRSIVSRRWLPTLQARSNRTESPANPPACVIGLLLCAFLVATVGCEYKKKSSTNLASKAGGSATAYSLAPYSGSATPTYLGQGWSNDQRQKFYTTSQGSQMMPLSWFIALEQANTTERFVSDGLIRFGYLPNPKGPLNPCSLPVGFTIDPAVQAGQSTDCPAGPNANKRPFYWVGMTCAACHTGRVIYHGTTLQIDGAPTNADLFMFLAEIDSAVRSTLKDEAKFDRFADRVAGPDTKSRHDLKNELTRFSSYFSTLIAASTPPIPWGPARADAFGMIFNRVSAIDLSDVTGQPYHALESNNATPNAPVSYPFLWGTSRQDYVQWNAVAPNRSVNARLARNVVEALGVFGRVAIQRPGSLLPQFPSTVNTGNQRDIEEKLIKNIRSPRWPVEVFGPLNPPKASTGQVLYAKYCATCHQFTVRDSIAPVKVCASPVSEIGTDPTMATNVACRKVDTGMLAGSPRLLRGEKLKQSDFVLYVAGKIGVGALLAGHLSLAQLGGLNPFRDSRLSVCSKESRAKIPPPRKAIASSTQCLEEQQVYRARPLDGIWATAPYLHNGSVPSLYQLLLPSNERIAKFYSGSREFDPNEVGFEYHSGPVEFDTNQAGNSKNGHEYGTSLSQEERQALLEYLKTL